MCYFATDLLRTQSYSLCLADTANNYVQICFCHSMSLRMEVIVLLLKRVPFLILSTFDMDTLWFQDDRDALSNLYISQTPGSGVL